MEPTIKANEVIFARSLRPDAPLAHGDIVVYRMLANGRLAVKRVVGLPGDNVEMRNGTFLLNGAAPSEPYVVHTGGGAAAGLDGELIRKRDNMTALTLPTGTVFLLGDNRDVSYDSRMDGPASRDSIVARVLWK
jgi:signal peptidase I